VACRARRAQHELLRLRLVDATLVVDGEVRGPGRGAYLCISRTCVGRARARDASALRRALAGRSRSQHMQDWDWTALDALEARSVAEQWPAANEGAQTP
jgi:predicted RNA-binding protein YlxR (DUF448 family)